MSNMYEHDRRFADNQRLVYFIIGKKFPWLVHDEDIAQVGMIGLWKACMTYDESVAAFSTYAGKCITTEILKELKGRSKEDKLGSKVSLDELKYLNDDSEKMTLADAIPDGIDHYCISNYDLPALKKKLSKKECDIMKLRLAGFTMDEIAKLFGGVSRQRIEQIIRKIKCVARAEYGMG